MSKIGYICVCAKDKTAGKKLDAVRPDIVFTDAVHSPAAEHAQLKQAIEHAKSGDQVFVEKLTHLGASRMDALRTISEFTNKGASLALLAENLSFAPHDDPMSILVKTLLSEFEPRKDTSAKKKAPAASAEKSKGKKSIRQAVLNEEQIAELKQRASAGENKTVLAKHYAISRESLLAYLRN